MIVYPKKSIEGRPSFKEKKAKKRPRVDVWEPRGLYFWGNQWVKILYLRRTLGHENFKSVVET